MNKADLVEDVAKIVGPATVAKAAVDCIFSNITRALKANETVRITGFGTFKVSRRKTRTAINPRTKEAMTLEERMMPKFLPAKVLKEAVDEE